MPETPVKTAPETASPKSSPSKKEIDAATMALNQFAQGKRNLVVGDIPSAVQSLQAACKLLAEQYGELAQECGDAYFCYGKALLEMARIENGVIGNALDGVPEGDDADNSQVENPEKLTDSEKVEVTELVEQALEENFDELQSKSEKTKENTKNSKVNGLADGDASGEEKKTASDSKVNGHDDKGDADREENTSNGTNVNGCGDGDASGKEKKKEGVESDKNEECKDVVMADETKPLEETEKKNSEETEKKNSEETEKKNSEETEKNSEETEKKKSEETEKKKSECVESGENGECQDVDMVDETKPSEETSAKEEAKPEQKDGSTENGDESDGDAESQEGDSQEEESQEGESQEGESQEGEEEEEKEGEGDKTEEEEDEVSNLQLSWEVLELAKVIFQKQADTNPKIKTKLAEVYLKLGEVGLEDENYSQGIEDFKQCLELQKSVLESDDRCLAETYYQLGISYSFCDDYDLSIESYKSAVNVLETRIANLQKIQKEKADWTEEQKMKDAATKADPFHTEQGEIDELNQLLPEMREKILDMEQVKKDSYERMKAAKEAMMSSLVGESSQGASSSSAPSPFGSSSNSFGGPSSSSTGKEAKPIMVVRKKRKVEESGVEDSKKFKAESGESLPAVNGAKLTNGQAENEPGNTTTEEQKEQPAGPKKVELKSVS